MAGFVLGDVMTWFNILKEQEVKPEPVRAVAPKTIKKQELDILQFKMGTDRYKILDATESEESLDKLVAENSVDGVVKPRFQQEIEFVKRYLRNDTITQRGKEYKTLRETLTPTESDKMADMLDKFQAKRASKGNVRGEQNANFKQLIDKEDFDSLMELLEKPMVLSRFRTFISNSENKELRDKVMQSNNEQLVMLLSEGEDAFPSIDYTASISGNQIEKYLRYIIIEINDRRKIEFIDLEKAKRSGKAMQVLFGTNRMYPAFEFILENKSFDTSDMLATQMTTASSVVSRTVANKKLIDALKRGEVRGRLQEMYSSRLPIEEDENRSEKEAVENQKINDKFKQAREKGDKSVLDALNEEAPTEVKEFKNSLIETEYTMLLSDIEDDDVEEVNEQLGTQYDNDGFEKVKGKLIEAVRELIAGNENRADEKFKELSVKGPSLSRSHPFDDENFTREYLLGGGFGASTSSPADIVKILQRLSTLFASGALKKSEIRKYFTDLENAEDEESKLEVKDKFLDEVRDDYENARGQFLEAVEDNMRRVLKEGTKLGITVRRQGRDYDFREPYMFLRKLLSIKG